MNFKITWRHALLFAAATIISAILWHLTDDAIDTIEGN